MCEAAPLVLADVWAAPVTGLSPAADLPGAGVGSALQLSW